MQKDCTDQHGWTQRKQGVDVRTKRMHAPNRLWVGTTLSTIFHFKPWSRLFIVDQFRTEGGNSGVPCVDELLQCGKAMLTQHRRDLEGHQGQKTIGNSEHHYTATA
jgi:hypothetical protein